MNCTLCGGTLPTGAAKCPTCGASTPYNINSPGQEVPVDPYPRRVSHSSSASQSVPEKVSRPPNPAAPYDVPQSFSYTPPPPPPPLTERENAERRQGFSSTMTILLIAFVIVIIGGSGLIYYAAIYQPAQRHAKATATAQAILTSQAQANARAEQTAQAFVNATATTQALATAQAVATATALQGIYTQATNGSPALNDPLTSNDANNWYVHTDSGGSCAFTGGALHATGSAFCTAQATSFSNLAFQTQVTILRGSGLGGLMFRLDITNQKLYLFAIGPDGSYILAYYTIVGSQSHIQTLIAGNSVTIKTGLNQTNLLAVIARGSTIYLYVNGQYVNQARNSALSTGDIGVFSSTSSDPAEVAFKNAQVWRL